MRSLQVWIKEYGESHKNHLNQIIHKVCVPLIYFSIIGMITSIPFEIQSVRIADLIIFIFMMRYLAFGVRAFGIMLILTVVCMAITHNWRIKAGVESTMISLIVVFILAWIGQFVGHQIEGKRPSFLKDLTFLLIGPLWVLKRYL